MGWVRRLRSTFVGSHVGHDFDEEMRFHLDERTAENIRLGMNAQDAGAAAIVLRSLFPEQLPSSSEREPSPGP